MDRPNLLLVFSDQHRSCDLGCYGNTQVVSPHLDAFAEMATRVATCVSNSPVCVPARGSMLTGLMPLRHGAVTNDLPMRTDVSTIAHVLAGNGYHTGYIGKWHLAGIPRDQCIASGERRFGFAEWKVCNCSHDYVKGYYYDEADTRIEVQGYEPVVQTDLAVDFIRRSQGLPWALTLSWGPPHDPYHTAPSEYTDLYADMKMELRPNVPDRIVDTLSSSLTREQIALNLRGYYAHISALDAQFGRLLCTLRGTGQLENTIVVYTSDHGDMLGSQGLTNKQLPYDEAIRVPLLVYWAGHTLALTTEELMGLVDLPVSLLGLMGLSFPDEVDGRDLHELFTREGAKGQDACYTFDLIPCHQSIARGGREWRGIRTRKHTYARTASDEGFALFDNEADPYQTRNLIHEAEYQSLKAEMAQALSTHVARHDALVPWEELIRANGLREAWNESQAYFGLPLLS